MRYPRPEDNYSCEVLCNNFMEIEEALTDLRLTNGIIDRYVTENSEAIVKNNEAIAKHDEDIAELDNEIAKNSDDIVRHDGVITQVKSDLNELSNMAAGAIVQKVDGRSIVVNDSSDDVLRGLRLFGKTEQFTTTGAQLFDFSHITNQSSYCSTDEDGYINFTGGSSTVHPSAVYETLESGEYTVSLSEVSGDIQFYFQPVTSDYSSSLTGDGSLTRQVDGFVRLLFAIPAGVTARCKLMFTKGKTPLPYEPYTGGIASPNPNYPQELVSDGKDGSVEVGVYGGNLFDITKHKENITATIIYNDDGSVTYRSDNAGEIGGYSQELTGLLPAGTYTINILGESLFYMTASGDYSNLWKGIHTFEYDGTSYLRFHGANISSNLSKTYKFMLNAGAEALPYEPYKEPQTLTALTPNGLPGIKVTDASLATYTDADGQKWCADEVDFERGVYVKRLKIRELDGIDESWNVLVVSTGTKIFSAPLSDACRSILDPEQGVVSNVGYKRYSVLDNGGYGLTYAYGIRIRFENMNPDNNTVDELKAYLAENPITVIYPLKTPIETPLSDEEIAQYRALHSNYPVTTILNDSDAHMEVKYNADTKSYIDNKFTELTNVILSMGGNV